MIKRILITGVLMMYLSDVAQAQQAALLKARQLYGESIEDAEKAEAFLDYMEELDPSSGILIAYLASAEALMGKHAWSPFSKLSWVRQGNETFSLAVGKDPQNPEIRFLRFSVQHYLPAFLGCSGNLEEDRLSIINNLENESSLGDDPELKRVIADFLIQSERCTEEEEKYLSRFL